MNPDFTQSLETKSLTEALSNVTAGESITYSEINKSINGDVQGASRAALATARRALLKHGYVFAVEHNLGLRRLLPREISLTTPRLLQKVRRAANKHAVELGTADMSSMTSDEQKRHGVSMLHTSLIAASVDRSTIKRVEESAPKAGPLTLEDIRRVYGS